MGRDFTIHGAAMRGRRLSRASARAASHSLSLGLALLLSLVAAVPARAAGTDAADSGSPVRALKKLNLEELMDVEVTSVSKQPERLLDAPSAIQVITGDDILRSGATTLPEALRLADNLDVAQQNSHDWAISARGFNANLANKLLVLVDGRAVYTPLYGGVLWNVQDYLLEDLDRIEVISGPGGALWGANAVNGVINLTSKTARDTQGAYVEGGGGSQLNGLGAVRYGGTLAPNVFFRVYAKYLDESSERLPDGTQATDSWQMARAGFRVDSYALPASTLTLQGDLYRGREFLGDLGDAKLNGGNLLGRWSHTFSPTSDISLQLYFDRSDLTQPFAPSPANPPFVSGFPLASLIDDLDTYDLDFQHHLALSERQKIVWGFGYRFTHESDEDLSVVRFAPPTLDRHLYNLFAQDEISLSRKWTLTLGSKVEHNDYTGYEFEPSGRLLWNASPTQSVWGAVSRAVRTPARYDRDLHVVSGLVNAPPPFVFPTDFLAGGADFQSESVIAYELGYRALLGSNVTIAVSTFYNAYDDLRSTTSTPTTATYIFPFPVFFENNLAGHTYGAELTTSWQVVPGWRLHAGYDLLRESIHPKPGQTDDTNGLNETADPEQQFSLSSSLDLPHRTTLDARLRWVDSFLINSGPTSGPVAATVPSYFELDVRLAWRATDRLEFSVVGQNLLHRQHPEYGYPSPTRQEIARSVFGKAAWRF